MRGRARADTQRYTFVDAREKGSHPVKEVRLPRGTALHHYLLTESDEVAHGPQVHITARTSGGSGTRDPGLDKSGSTN